MSVNSGTLLVFCLDRDTSGTRPKNPGLSRPFRDSWQLCNSLQSVYIPPVRIVGAPVSMRTHSGRGNAKLAAESIVYAHFARRAAVLIIANSMVGHPLESLPVSSPQNTMSTRIIILQTGSGVLTFRRIVAVSYPHFVGALPPPPPQIK